MIIRYRLQAYMADNDAGGRMSTRLRLRIRNASHLSRRRANLSAPQSTYVWTLDDASIVGMPGLDGEAGKVFAIALSVQSWRFLHSPVILNIVSEPEHAAGATVFGNLTIKHTSPPRILDERYFVAAATALTGAWRSRRRTARAAMNAYWDALHAVRTRPRFLSLYAAFEMAVNFDGKGRSGVDFDEHAAAVTGGKRGVIKRLRRLNNRLKHAKAVRAYKGKPASVGREAGELKRLADHALASRLGFQLHPTYGD